MYYPKKGNDIFLVYKIMDKQGSFQCLPSKVAGSLLEIASVTTVEAFPKADPATFRFSLCNINFTNLNWRWI